MAHFYREDGTLVSHVPYADPAKGMREATLADARKLGLVPSVTTILQTLSKPQLVDWQISEALKVALPMAATAAEPDILREVKRQSEAYRDWSAEFGTQVHHCISTGLKGAMADSTMLGVWDVVEGFLDWMGPNGLQITESEVGFYSHLGYGGTIDILGTYYGDPCIGDIKTQDFGGPNDGKAKPAFYDPEWPMQMAGYDIGVNAMQLPGFPDGGDNGLRYDTGQPLTRISFVLSRTKPGLVVAHQWGNPERYDAAWLSLFDHWQATHKWGKWATKPTLELLQGGLFDA